MHALPNANLPCLQPLINRGSILIAVVYGFAATRRQLRQVDPTFLQNPVGIRFVLVAFLWLLGIANAVAEGGSDNDYILSTTQIADPLRPLEHASVAAKRIQVQSAVVTVADPVETHLGRVFDSQIAALISAFQLKDYVLDGFALTWRLEHFATGQDAKQSPREIFTKGTAPFADQHRSKPSVLVFRKDVWRSCSKFDSEHETGAKYFVVFLVGESPTVGVHPKAFESAARCALRLAHSEKSDKEFYGTPDGSFNDIVGRELPCDFDFSNNTTLKHSLRIIGPSFSGSMESLALKLSTLRNQVPKFDINLTSPTATVDSNENIAGWIKAIDSKDGELTYSSNALSLKEQLKMLAEYLDGKLERSDEGRDVVILAEESTFGNGVRELIKNDNAQKQEAVPENERYSDFLKRLTVSNFPQNIASIRAERSQIAQQTSTLRREQFKAERHLLELDLSGSDPIIDRPPPYSPALSSRSDELMLYGLFDNLNVWVKPKVVVIIATDVRDRLFLLNEVRKTLPTALPVLMEIDSLTAHPDYRKITRGVVVLPTGHIRLCFEDGDGCLTSCPRIEWSESAKWLELPDCKECKKCLECQTSDESQKWLKLKECLELKESETKCEKQPECEECVRIQKEERSYLSFSSDHAANMFRATFDLIDSDTANFCEVRWTLRKMAPFVTTLAGFQEVEVILHIGTNSHFLNA